MWCCQWARRAWWFCVYPMTWALRSRFGTNLQRLSCTSLLTLILFPAPTTVLSSLNEGTKNKCLYLTVMDRRVCQCKYAVNPGERRTLSLSEAKHSPQQIHNFLLQHSRKWLSPLNFRFTFFWAVSEEVWALSTGLGKIEVEGVCYFLKGFNFYKILLLTFKNQNIEAEASITGLTSLL